MRPEPLKLEDALKQFSHDQDKIITPEQTIDRFRERLARTGLDILDDVVRIDNGRLDIPVYFSVCGPEARATIGNYKQMGKGATPSQSMASAVMELGERFSLFSFYRNAENFIHATAREISEPKMAFAQIARSVSDDSQDLAIATRFFETLPLKWTWAHNLTSGEVVMVPFNWFWTINEYNGSSAGNCNEEALCQGICEVVERHVCASISRQRTQTPLIDIDSVTDPVAVELIDKFRKNGVELVLSDFTREMGIPSVGALAWDPQTFPQKSEIVWTAGTTPSATKALCRALTEVAQLAGDFDTNANYVASGLPKFQSLEAADYVIHPGQSVPLGDLPELGDNNIKLEVERCVAALASRDMDVFVVDIRHPLLEVPAFYTIIPGAQFRERAAHSSVGMMIAKIITDTFAPEQALARLKEFDRALPGKYYLQFYIGQLLLDRGEHQDALDSFAKALALEPPDEDMASVYTYMGLCYKELSRFDKAREVLEKGHRTDPLRTDTLNLLGFSHYKLGHHEQAIACFEQLIALDPSSAIDYANIASNYRAMGEKNKAIEYYRLALALDENIEFAKVHLTQLGVNPNAE